MSRVGGNGVYHPTKGNPTEVNSANKPSGQLSEVGTRDYHPRPTVQAKGRGAGGQELHHPIQLVVVISGRGPLAPLLLLTLLLLLLLLVAVAQVGAQRAIGD